MQSTGPIAVFDSGYGGLTVLSHLLEYFPTFDFIYYGDNARSPYGSRSFEVVYKYTREAVLKLFDLGAPLIILACNTASARALRTIQREDLPKTFPSRRVLGVIRPSVEELGNISQTKHVGILGTSGTITSESYPLEIKKMHPNIIVTQEACPMWVPLVENNEHLSPGAHYFVKKNLENLFRQDPKIDTIILGCTHYPLLIPLIKQYLKEDIKILEQGKIVAKSLDNYLSRHPEMNERISKNGSRHFYTSESLEKFEQTAELFIKQKIKAERIESSL